VKCARPGQCASHDRDSGPRREIRSTRRDPTARRENVRSRMRRTALDNQVRRDAVLVLPEPAPAMTKSGFGGASLRPDAFDGPSLFRMSLAGGGGHVRSSRSDLAIHLLDRYWRMTPKRPRSTFWVSIDQRQHIRDRASCTAGHCHHLATTASPSGEAN
jgi:hypothetical protein